MHHRLIPVILCTLLLTCCKNKQNPPAAERLPDLLAAGRYAPALEMARAEGERDLEVMLLARQGSTPEAMDAYVRRLADGLPHDAILLEAVMLSSYPPAVRMDPALLLEPDRPAYGQATHQALVQLLAPELKGQVPRNRLADLVGLLAIAGRNDAIDALVECVDQRTEPLVRMTALTALATIGTPEAVETLGEIADRFKVSTIMLRHVLDALALVPDANPEVASSLLDNENQRVRTKAAGILARSKDPRADALLLASGTVEARVALLARGTGPEGTREQVAEHVASLAKPLDKARFLDLMREISSSETLDVVCTLARDPDPGVATNAAHTLGHIGDEAAAPCLVEAARSDDKNIRITALKMLVSLPADSAAELLAIARTAAKQEDVTSEAIATAAIGRAGGDDAVSILEKLLESEQPRVRDAAAVALFSLGDDGVMSTIEKAIADTEGPWDMNQHTEWILLGTDPDERTLPIVRKAVNEGNPSLRDKTLSALLEARHPEGIFLLEKVQLERYGDVSLEFRSPGSGKVFGTSIGVMQRLQEEGDADGRRALLERLVASEDAYLRAVGLRLMTHEDAPWALDKATSMLEQEDDPWMRLEAVRALAVIVAGGGAP
jgi:HEAT repeat protein